MLDESEPETPNCLNPSMNRHRPASLTSQDISHVLASVFRELYTTEVVGRDTVANLCKSSRGRDTYHDKYVEDLQQVHRQSGQRLWLAELLEQQVVQARRSASRAEGSVQRRLLQEEGGGHHTPGLLPGQSTFLCCVDNKLLKSNDLICPEDCITQPAPLVKAPRGQNTPHFAQPTVSHNRHMCRMPQEDGYRLIPPPDNSDRLLEGSEVTFTLSSSQDHCSMRTIATKDAGVLRRMAWGMGPCAELSASDRAALLRLQRRHNFLRNPRFLPPHHPGGKSLLLQHKGQSSTVSREQAHLVNSSSQEFADPVLIATPPMVVFTEYRVGHVYEATVELRNVTAFSRHLRVIPPSTHHFSISLGRFPGEAGVVAPGMSCCYTLRFVPDSLADYQDFIAVETHSAYPLIVPVEAHRPPPILTLPAVLECGVCLVGGACFKQLLIRNEGLTSGTFCIMPRRLWPAASLRAVVKASFAEEPPFAISPSLFQLQPDQTIAMEVVFFPSAAGSCWQDFTVVCDNCQVRNITLQGVGQHAAVELVCVSGGEDEPAVERHDLSVSRLVQFGSANPFCTQQRSLAIRNHTHLELPFQWQVIKPPLQAGLPGETPDPAYIHHHVATDDSFSISPPHGVLAPLEEHEFLLTYHPQEMRDYHSVCCLVLQGIPDQPSEDSGSQQLDQVPRLSDVVVMEIEVKGSTEPLRILLEPYAIIIPGLEYTHTPIRRDFRMWNHSKSVIHFEWEGISDCHTVEVQPQTGGIEVNECLDCELVLTGGRPGRFDAILQCHIQHQQQPLGMPVQASFKGAEVCVGVDRVDLGLLRPGEEGSSTLILTNPTHLPAHWSIHTEKLKAEPSEGVLMPLSSCSVSVRFCSLQCQHFETVLEIRVYHGTGCLLCVCAGVQAPQVCLLSSVLVFSELYVGVQQRGTVTLFNQTPLPTRFTWTKLLGPQAHLCSVTFSPSSGSLEPNAQMETSVSLTANTDEELSGVAAVCEVEGMTNPLLLGFSCKANPLRVSYSQPNTDCTDDISQQPLSLDFSPGDPVIIGQSVSRELMITNHTAILATFTLEPEHFTVALPTHPATPSLHRGRRLLHSVQARRLEERAHQECVRALLAHGKGAAFLVQPNRGKLLPFGSQAVRITAHCNMWGDYQDWLVCQVGNMEPTLIPMRLSVGGCPLHFQMIGPQPDNQNQGPIIRFGTHVSGGDTVSRSLRLNNISPYDIRVDWVTYNLEADDRKLVDVEVAYGEPFPLRDSGGNEVMRGRGYHTVATPMWDEGHAPRSDGSTTSLRSRSESEEEEQTSDEDDEGRGLISLAPMRKLVSAFIRPHHGNAADYPYCITPQQTIVPAGGSSSIHVSFTPLTLSEPTPDPRCLGFALGYLTLDAKGAAWVPGKVQRAQRFHLQPIRVELEASVRTALLTIQMEDEEEVIEFQAVASDVLQGEQSTEAVIGRTLQLRNDSETPLSFTLSTQPPFGVHPPHTHLLQPTHNLQVRVSFHVSLSLLANQQQPCEELPPSITLLCSDTGERSLRFTHTLQIEYSNNTTQMVPLCAYLAIPTLHLSCPRLDFGHCCVGEMQVREVQLHNSGASHSHWTAHIDAEQGSNVFRVAPDKGVLKPQEFTASCRQPLQISFTARAPGCFQAVVRLQGMLGELALALPVQGVALQGVAVRDERFASPLPDS